MDPCWYNIDIDPCFRRIDYSNFNVQPNNEYSAIAKYVESLYLWWQHFDIYLTLIKAAFSAKIFEKLPNAHQYLCDTLLREYIRDHEME